MRWRRLAPLAALWLTATFCAPAWGHKLIVHAEVVGTEIAGEAYFPPHQPASHCRVEIFGPGGDKLAEARTDSAGKFRLPIPKRCPLKIVVDADELHMGLAEIPIEQLATAPSDAPASTVLATPLPPSMEPSSASVVEQLQAERQALREEKRAFAETLRWRDLLAGVGYIVGIFGLIGYWKARQMLSRCAETGDRGAA